jgi:phenylpropionate dioxygenase-like ring-hydroxylating dioxygenase large terminal subunit
MTARIPWVTEAWYAVLWAEQLDAGTIVPRTVLEEEIVLYRDSTGAPVALEDCCMHRFVPLSLGSARIMG